MSSELLESIPKFWPGGIPEHIRNHPEPIPYENLAEEVKGWQLFLDENYVPYKTWPPRSRAQIPPEEEAYELTHRRALTSQWASFPQSTRDDYHSRAPVRNSRDRDFPLAAAQPSSKMSAHFGKVQCIAPLNTPRNKALWTKLRILLNMDGRYSANGVEFDHDNISCIDANPETSTQGEKEEVGDITVENFLRVRSVEQAVWRQFSMTRTGTVVYRWLGPFLIVDQEALETGRLFLCEFENNGRLSEDNVRVRALNLADAMIHLNEGQSVGYILHSIEMVKDEGMNAPMPMELPVLDILTEISEHSIQHLDGDWDDFADKIEELAPGYLELEEQSGGMVADYDQGKFQGRDDRIEYESP